MESIHQMMYAYSLRSLLSEEPFIKVLAKYLVR